MAGFRVTGDISSSQLKKLDASSLTAAVGDLIELTAGSTTWAACTSSSNYFSRKAVVMEAVTAASTVLAYEVHGNEVVIAEAGSTANSAHNGDRMVLTDTNTVNNSGTDNTSQNVCFIQDGVTSSELVGRIVVGPGVDPDAT